MNIPLLFSPAPVGNRFKCDGCGGEVFFIALEAEATPSGPMDNIECFGCHKMWVVAVRYEETQTQEEQGNGST